LVYVDSADTASVRRFWKAGNYHRSSFLWGWMLPHPTFFVRRNIYEQFGVFRTDFRQSADYELILRFLYKNKIAASYIPRVLIRMRNGGASNATLKNRLTANREDRLAWKVNELRPLPFTHILKPLRKIMQFF
jgi:glycosyltransferase